LRLIDTNIVIYAAGKAHPLQEGEARKVLDRITEGTLHANIDAEVSVLQEILHVYSARKQ
jgi:predicted nucleic acid-binding protein